MTISPGNRKNGTPAVCVFCASSNHVPEIYAESARRLGTALAERGMSLVYGGGNNGLMGVLSEQVHEHGGRITGVIPEVLRDMGFAYSSADEMIVTDDLRERKALMERLSDGFIGLAGGFGTLEEMLELITLKQLGLLDKPVVFLNTGNFFSGLLEQFETSYREHIIDEECRGLYYVTSSVDDALEYISGYGKIRVII